jgi:hypothetical protein
MALSIASSLAAPIPSDTRRIVTRGICQSCMGKKDATNPSPRKRPPADLKTLAAEEAMIVCLGGSTPGFGSALTYVGNDHQPRRPTQSPSPQMSLKAVATANQQIEAARNDAVAPVPYATRPRPKPPPTVLHAADNAQTVLAVVSAMQNTADNLC